LRPEAEVASDKLATSEQSIATRRRHYPGLSKSRRVSLTDVRMQLLKMRKPDELTLPSSKAEHQGRVVDDRLV